MNRLLALASAALALTAAPLAAQDVAITGATVALGDGSDPVENATVVVRGGRVVAAGAGVAVPAGVPVLDGSGAWVTPGLFASLTELGIYDVQAVDESNDVSASGSPFSAALDVSPIINPNSQDILISRAGGVTRASVTPSAGASIFAGQGAIIDTGADYQPLVRPRAFQVVEMGERGARLAGGSRTSSHALLRNALQEASQYGEDAELTGRSEQGDIRTGDDLAIDPRLAGRAERDTDVLLTRFDAAALVPVVTGEQQLYVKVERASDILSALSLTKEFPDLDMVLVGATEGWLVADQIAAAGVPVIAAALRDLPASFEQLAATQSNLGRMADAGVRVAIGIYDSSGDHPRGLPQAAGNLVALSRVPGASGLSWGEAFAAISSVPASIAGLDGEAGVLAEGAYGDLVVWDGDPLETSSAPIRVFVEGVEQPLDNHQTRLRERYRSLDESERPLGYVH
ncbi:amidohydrolase family protein [Aurantiacibacter poecillastricola]|uniref:amidohydrolase family protein n=1 Tax=Aurantiacibacter poecillastricola TaxID=3064385 RepID=UPI00273D6A38|nr:amidohydrolase family protein [Aurantiacibacter sp. 219JJ12-13]MDP5260639.1 amidohydrolase family protein [Aurantiacibacter sp. 219JJ12-13]